MQIPELMVSNHLFNHNCILQKEPSRSETVADLNLVDLEVILLIQCREESAVNRESIKVTYVML